MTHLARILFLLVIVAITVIFAFTSEIQAKGENYITVFILIPVLLGLAVVVVDMFWRRKRLHEFSGVFFGVLAGLVFAFMISLIVDFVVAILPSSPPYAEAPESLREKPTMEEVLFQDRPDEPKEIKREDYPNDTAYKVAEKKYDEEKAKYDLYVTEKKKYDKQHKSWLTHWKAHLIKEKPYNTYVAFSKTVQLIKMLLGASAIFLCVTIVMQTKDDFRFVIPYIDFSRQAKGAHPILLDTSVIIDGRIADVADTGVLDSEVVVPRFVLAELHTIADSADKLKRNRGRRGLDMLNRLQSNENIDIQILDPHDPEVAKAVGVDAKLIALARNIDAKIMTNDFNLNKVSTLRGVKVININDLANSLKPVVLPSEKMTVRIVKPGEEPGQGVGFLDDGTMIVVADARDYTNQEVTFVVTSVLQTSAGKMIFGQIDADAAEWNSTDQ